MAQMPVSIACRIVARRLIAPTTTANASLGWRAPTSPYSRMDFWLRYPRPRTWTITVNKIKGQPHIQSASQLPCPSKNKLRVVCAVIMQAFLSALQRALAGKCNRALIALGSDDALEEYLDASQRQTTKTTSITLSIPSAWRSRPTIRFDFSKTRLRPSRAHTNVTGRSTITG
jgi:hypothetical protein